MRTEIVESFVRYLGSHPHRQIHAAGTPLRSHEMKIAIRTTMLVIGLSACRAQGAPGSTPHPAQAASTTPSVRADECAAQAMLDHMDSRTAVPLLPMMANHQKQNMRDHLLAVQEIVMALAADDFTRIEAAAGRIGYSEQMGMMCRHMGTGAPGFTDQALNFHHTADTIGAAARQHDRDGVVRALGATLQTCTGCHATFRQHVVDEQTWHQVGGTMPGMMTGH